MMASGTSCTEEEIECPLCAKYFPVLVINAHVDDCLSNANLEKEENFKEETIFENSSSETCDQSTSDFSRGKNQDSFRQASLETVSPCSRQTLDSDHVLKTESRKDVWSFLKSSKTSPGHIKIGQTSKLSVSKNPTHPNFRKHPVDSIEEENSGSTTMTNAKRMKLQSSETIHSSKIAPDSQTASSNAGKGFKSTPSGNLKLTIPLAERMRPSSLDEFVGQEEVVGINALLRRLLESDTFPSMILWGPPGCGKTTLARIVANRCRHLPSWRFVQLSATMSGIADIKEAVNCAKNEKSSFKRKTVLFIDEIHRFNKLQQDTFLPHVEDGTIILIGATTENPSFNVNGALLSRCKVIVLEKLSAENIENILKRTLKEISVGFLLNKNEIVTNCASSGETFNTYVVAEVVSLISHMCDGDARYALNCLQNLVDSKSSVNSSKATIITVEDAKQSLLRSHVQYDRTGEEHYNCASALQKSIRGSSDDGAIYWLARMLEGGEDPLFIARRLVSCASEDIGLADAQALPLAVSTFQACHFLGMPECALNLAHCTTYLARAPKSNEAYAALNRARESIRKHAGPLPGVPLHLRNAPTKLMKDLGYHKGYQYNHNIKGPVNQDYLPAQLLGTSFFKTSS